MNSKIKIVAPASVSNLGSAFDAMGFALNVLCDEVIMEKNSDNRIIIKNIIGKYAIPSNPQENVGTVALRNYLDKLETNCGFTITIKKMIKPGSGLGTSASSGAAVVAGANYLLGEPLKKEELVPFVMEGEKLVSGAPHADNAAPAVLGGIVLIRSNDPLDIIPLPVPGELNCIVVHPQVEVQTKKARQILKSTVLLTDAVKQWANVGGLVASFYESDYDLLKRSISDYIIEPQRSELIPGYFTLKNAAMEAGALGCNISGSGPAVFAFARGEENTRHVEKHMVNAYKKESIPFTHFHSKINLEGTKVV